jgi:hypothetical protein
LRFLVARFSIGTTAKTITSRPLNINVAHEFWNPLGIHNCAEVCAVVATVTENAPGVPATTWTVAGTLHVGALLGAGLTEQDRFTVPLNPFEEVADSVNLALCPAVTDADEEPDEEGASEKAGGCDDCTVRACEALCERLPEAPAMPIVYAAGDALAVVFTVSVEETTPALEAVTVAGLKLHDTPADKPLAHDRVTVPENPPRELIETVELEELPAAMLAGENAVAEIWKSLPLPNMGTSSGVDTESLTEIFADRKPPAAGVNVTFTVQLAPTAKVPPQLLV